MNWRLHLSSQPLRRVDLLVGRESHVAVQPLREQVRFYEVATGAHYGDLTLDPDLLDRDDPETRQAGFQALHAPNGVFLPMLNFNGSQLHISRDGRLRLIHDLDAGISLEAGTELLPLDVGENATVLLASLERDSGAVAAWTSDHHLHLFQQQQRLSSILLDAPDPLMMFWTNGGSQLILLYPAAIQIIDHSGKVLKTQPLHYTVGLAALAPNGQWLVIGDAEYQMLRLYDADLNPIRQQHALDLLAEARQLQLFANLPSELAPLAALDISNNGTLAFAVAGTLCVSHINMLTKLPAPRASQPGL